MKTNIPAQGGRNPTPGLFYKPTSRFSSIPAVPMGWEGRGRLLCHPRLPRSPGTAAMLQGLRGVLV